MVVLDSPLSSVLLSITWSIVVLRGGDARGHWALQRPARGRIWWWADDDEVRRDFGAARAELERFVTGSAATSDVACRAMVASSSSSASDSPRKRRVIVPPAHLRLSEEPKSTAEPPLAKAPELPRRKRGEVAALIRSMPDAAPDRVVETARAHGIQTTVEYVRWRRWADGKGAAARKPRAKAPKDVPAMVKVSPFATEKVEGSSRKRGASKTQRKPVGSRVASRKPTTPDEASFRGTVTAYVLEHGLLRARVILDAIEANLRALVIG